MKVYKILEIFLTSPHSNSSAFYLLRAHNIDGGIVDLALTWEKSSHGEIMAFLVENLAM